MNKELEEMMKKYPIAFEGDSYVHDLKKWKYRDVCDLEPTTGETKYKPVNPDWEYPHLNQTIYPMCQGFTTAQIASCIKGVAPLVKEMFSPGWIYFYRPSGYGQSRGLSTDDAFKTCCKVGLIKEKDFSVYGDYTKDVNPINDSNREYLINLASKYKMSGYVDIDPEDVSEYMAKHNNAPMDLAFRCYENVYDALKTGEYPSERKGKCIGSHAVTLKGEDDTYFYTLSTWGEGVSKGIIKIRKDSPMIISITGFIDIKEKTKEPINAQWVEVKPTNPSEKTRWKWQKSDCSYAASEWINVGNKWYYIDKNGYAIDGDWFQDTDGHWYYLDAGTCEMHVGWLAVGSDWYYMNPKVGGPKGSMMTGWIEVDGQEYYLEKVSGKNMGHMYCNGTYLINRKLYSFNSKGHLIK